jgi:glycosyltransferase involved in cell wall biosynthesis
MGVGIETVGLEIVSDDSTYLWRQETNSTPFTRYVVLPEQSYEDVSALNIWRGISNSLNKIQPDVVAICGYSSPDALAALVWCKLNNRKAILMMESKQDDAPRQPVKERLKQQIVGQFDAALCGGSSHRDYLIQLGMSTDQIFLGYDAVDNIYFRTEAQKVRLNSSAFDHLPGLDSESPFFLASSRFIKRKNLGGLLEAYAKYRQTIADSSAWRLIILGDGEERGNLHQLANELELSDVVWPGFRQIAELPAYYGLAGAFIHPARQEQWGLVVNEAMAAGLPVLVSQTCGCARDLVLEGETGFTFDPEDTNTLVGLMVQVSSGQVDRETIGQAAQRHINRWGTERFAQGLYEAIEAAIDKR